MAYISDNHNALITEDKDIQNRNIENKLIVL